MQERRRGLFLLNCQVCVCVCVCAAQIRDRGGELTARMNVSDLQLVLGLRQNTSNTNSSAFIESPPDDSSLPGNITHNFPQTLKPHGC